jgi:hypothetical protein
VMVARERDQGGVALHSTTLIRRDERQPNFALLMLV